MEPEELRDEEDFPVDCDADEWDEETLGLDVDELDVETVTREIGARY